MMLLSMGWCARAEVLFSLLLVLLAVVPFLLNSTFDSETQEVGRFIVRDNVTDAVILDVGALPENLFIGKRPYFAANLSLLYLPGNENDSFCKLLGDGIIPDWNSTAVLLGNAFIESCEIFRRTTEAFSVLCASQGVIILEKGRNMVNALDGDGFRNAPKTCVLASFEQYGLPDASREILSAGYSNLVADLDLPQDLQFSSNMMLRLCFSLLEMYHLVLRPLAIIKWRFDQRKRQKAAFKAPFIFSLVFIAIAAFISVLLRLLYLDDARGIPESVIWIDVSKFFGASVGIDFISLAIYEDIVQALRHPKQASSVNRQSKKRSKRKIRYLTGLGVITVIFDFIFIGLSGRYANIRTLMSKMLVLYTLLQILAVSLVIRATLKVRRLLSESNHLKLNAQRTSDSEFNVFQRMERKIRFWMIISMLAAAANIVIFSMALSLTRENITIAFVFYQLSMMLTRVVQVKVFEPLTFDISKVTPFRLTAYNASVSSVNSNQRARQSATVVPSAT